MEFDGATFDPDKDRLMRRKSGGKTKVLNKAPAPEQITAEQILREAFERQPAEHKAPAVLISDPDELKSYQLRKRKEFEDVLRRQKHSAGVWMKYADWEETQKEYERVRSIFERALDVDYRNHTLWLKYAEFEMKNRFVNHARNVWDRAVQLLPRIDQLWYKYALMEEMLGNMDRARTIFERWMKWHPGANAWESFIKLEMRMPGRRLEKVNSARKIWLRYTRSDGEVDSYMKWAKWEEKHGDLVHSREVYARALEELGEQAHIAKLFMAFAALEQKAKETERARVIYKFALDHVPKHLATELYSKYTSFEKQFGGRDTIDTVILSKRRFEYEEELKKNPRNYDIWFDYVKLEESNKNFERIREIYERAIAQFPPLREKRYWKRYIFLWLRYAIFEELDAKDPDRAAAVLQKCSELVPHDEFTFGKLWIHRAKLEVRRKNLSSARRILGEALGRCPKASLFTAYIELEAKLLEMDRVRKLYEKFLEFAPDNCEAWHNYAKVELSQREIERARSIYELAIGQEALDMPESIWKNYIDFETHLKEYANSRNLYRRLLERTKNYKVWKAFAVFEASINELDRARAVFKKADSYFKSEGDDGKLGRVDIVEAWKKFEDEHGTDETRKEVAKRVPKTVKKKKLIRDASGAQTGWQEYVDYIFPDSEQRGNLAILEAARAWKKRKLEAEEESEEESSDDDEDDDDEDESE